jgi:hypothetical protein
MPLWREEMHPSPSRTKLDSLLSSSPRMLSLFDNPNIIVTFKEDKKQKESGHEKNTDSHRGDFLVSRL